jgi:hypothetical protein
MLVESSLKIHIEIKNITMYNIQKKFSEDKNQWENIDMHTLAINWIILTK